MKAGKLIFLSVAIMLVLPVMLQAQDKIRFKIRVDSVANGQGNIIAIIPAGSAIGIHEGMIGKLYKAKGNDPADFSEVAIGSVSGVSNGSASMVVRYTPGEQLLLEQGDLFVIDLPRPKRRYPNVYFDLALEDIYLRDYISGKPYYSLASLLADDGADSESAISRQIIRAAAAFAEMMKDKTGADLVFNRVAKGGRYKGETLRGISGKLAIADVRSFALYIKDYPKRYTAQDYVYLETFGGWFYSDAPFGTTEVKEALFPIYKNSKLLAAKIVTYADAIRSENMGYYFASDANELADQGKLAESAAMLDFAGTITELLHDDKGKAGVHLIRAQLLQDKEQFAAAVVECDKSIAICRRYQVDTAADYSDFKRTEVKAGIKKGYCLYKASMYKGARETLEELVPALRRYRKVLGDADYLYFMSKRYSYAGYFDYVAKDYVSALGNYRRAIKYNDTISTRASWIMNADMLVQIGKILVSQQNTDEAVLDFDQAMKIYQAAGEETKAKSVIPELGLAWYEASDYVKSLAHFNEAYANSMQAGDSSNAGYLQSLMGISYGAQGKPELAIQSHQKALQLRKGSYGQAYSWNQLGTLYQSTGLKDKALAALDSATVYYRLSADSSGLEEVYERKGKVYLQDQQYLKGIAELEKASRIPERVSAELLYELGSAWINIDTSKARSFFERCLKESIRSGNSEYEFYASVYLSRIMYLIDEKAKARVYAKRVEELAGNIPRKVGENYSLKAFLAMQELESDSALRYYQQAWQVYDTIDKYTAITILSEIANVYISQGDFEAAERTLEAGRNSAKSINGNLQEGSALVDAAFVKALKGDHANALALVDSAIMIFSRSGNQFTLANAMVAKGGFFSTVDRYADAVATLLKADSIYLSQNSTMQQESILNNIGVAYYGQGDYTNAIKYFRKIEAKLRPGVVDERRLLTMSNLSEAYYDNKQFAEAEKAAQYYPIAKKKGMHRLASVMALTLGKLAFDKKDYGKVQEYVDYVRTVSARGGNRSLSDVYVLEGKTDWKMGKLDQAAVAFDKATAVAAKFELGSQSWISFYEAGLFYYERGMYDSAIARLKYAVDRVEQGSENLLGGAEGKALYNNDPRKLKMYTMISSALIKTNREKEAFAYANRSNITGMQVLNGPSVADGNEDKKAALQGLGELQQKKVALEKSVADLGSGAAVNQSKLLAIQQQTKIVEAEYSKYVEDLIAKYPEIGLYFQRNANPDDFYNYKGEIPDDMAVLLYLPNGNDLMIFTLTNEDLSVQVVQMKEGINTAISAFKSLTKNRGKSSGTGPVRVRSEVIDEEPVPANISFKDVSAELYALLFGSVEDKVGMKKKLCIIPNGNFSNLPFQCLGKVGADGSFHFLLEDHALFYTNQLDLFKGSRGDQGVKKPMGTFAAFGVPDQTLRFNLDEVRTIGHIIGSDSTVYADGRATESAARESLMHKKIIHFATHGTLNYNQYSQSYLKFLPDKDTANGRDGRLTIDEIKKMLIPGCDLVTLSACETAVNSQLVKGWNISPANAFLQRKVKSVVASLWKVDDEATSLLMKSFYQNLSDGMEKVEALRRAQETLSREPKYAHPYFWGAFVLFGDWR